MRHKTGGLALAALLIGAAAGGAPDAAEVACPPESRCDDRCVDLLADPDDISGIKTLLRWPA